MTGIDVLVLTILFFVFAALLAYDWKVRNDNE